MRYNTLFETASLKRSDALMVALMNKLSVLIVDDSQLNRLLLARIMHKVQCLWLRGNPRAPSACLLFTEHTKLARMAKTF